MKNSKTGQDRKPHVSLFDHRFFFAGAGAVALLIAAIIVYFVNFVPDLSDLKITVFSGPTTGNYYTTVSRAAEIAQKSRGRIDNVSTNGSIDNIARLDRTKKRGVFALAQNGMPWGKGLELIAHIKSPETVFFLGPDADRIHSITDIKNMRIGIGPKGSGTAHLAESIFNTPRMKALNVTLSYHTNDEQLKLLRERKLDLGIFVISEKSSFIEKAVCDEGMRIASFRQCESIAMRLPCLRAEGIREGLYDPVRMLPSSDRHVLKVDTLLVGNGKARRSQVIGLLTVFSELNPNLINSNRSVTNHTGMAESSAARDFFNNQGPETLDRYAPRLVDLIPLGGLVQLAMAISIFFNLMGMANRFFLWRIDANRVSIEGDIRDFFSSNLLPEEIERLEPKGEHKTAEAIGSVGSLIARLEALRTRSRKQSQSILVPMGAEMAYRYQEDLISIILVALRSYRSRLERA